MHFTILRGNVKAQRSEVTLTPKTVITGPNKAGKTSHLSAIELALTAKHKGTNRRQPGKYLNLTKDEHLSAELEGDGISAILSVRPDARGKVGVSHEVLGFPDTEALEDLFPGESYVAMGGDKMRELMFRRFAAIKGRPRPKVMDETLTTVWDEAASKTKTTDPAEFLAEIDKILDRTKRDYNAQIKYLTSKVKETQAFLAEAGAGHELLPQLEAQLVEAKAFERAANVRTQLDIRRGQLAAVDTKIEQAEATLKAAKSAADRAKAAQAGKVTQIKALEEQAVLLKDGRADLIQKVNRMEALLDFLHAADKAGIKSCIACGSDHEPKIEAWEKRLAARQAELTESMEKSHRIKERTQGLLKELQDVLRANSTDQIERELSQHHAQRNSVAMQIKTLEDSLGQLLEYEGPSAAELTVTVRNAREAKEKSERLEEMMVEADHLKRLSDSAKHLQKAAKELQSQVLVSLKTSAESKVNEYMVDGFVATYDLERNTWMVIGTDGRPHDKTTLCGAELTALESALTRTFLEDQPFKIVLLDRDRDLTGFSAENFQKLCDRYSDLVDQGLLDQVIMTWINPDEVPDNWSKIEL